MYYIAAARQSNVYPTVPPVKKQKIINNKKINVRLKILLKSIQYTGHYSDNLTIQYIQLFLKQCIYLHLFSLTYINIRHGGSPLQAAGAAAHCNPPEVLPEEGKPLL